MWKSDGVAGAGRHISARVMEAALVAAIVGVVGFVAAPLAGSQPWFAGGADAAPKVKATMSMATSTVAVNDVLRVTGAGLDPNRQTWARTETSSAVGWWSVGVRADGTYAVDLTFPDTGSATISLYQIVNNRTVLVSTGSVLVI